MTELSWDQTFDDHVDAHRRLVWDRILLRWPPLAALTVFAVGLGAMVHWVAAALLALFIAVVLWSAAGRRSVVRQLEAVKDSLVIGPVRWELDASGILLELPRRRLTVPWSGIQRIRRRPELTLLYVGRARALFVPERAVEDMDALVARIEAWRADPSEARELALPEDAAFRFAWDTTADDHIAYVSGVMAQQPMRLGLVFLGAAVALFASLQVPMILLDGLDVLVAVPCMLVPFGLLMIGVGLGGRTMRLLAPLRVRYAIWRDPDSFPVGAMDLRCDDLGVSYRSTRGSGTVRWAVVSSVDDHDGCVNLMLGPLLGFSIPDRAFDDREARDRFLAEADRRASTAARKSEVTGQRGTPVETDNPFEAPGP